MGGCATKPNSILDDMPEEKAGSPRQQPQTAQGPAPEGVSADSAKTVDADSAQTVDADSAKTVDADSAQTVDADNAKKADAEKKEPPVVDLSQPTSNSQTDSDQAAAESSTTAATSNAVSDQLTAPTPESVDLEKKAPEANHAVDGKPRTEEADSYPIPRVDSEKVPEAGKQNNQEEAAESQTPSNAPNLEKA